MGTSSTPAETERDEEFTLRVDDRGRVTLPKRVRERLGIEPDDEIPATLRGSVLTVDPQPSASVETATAGHGEWAETTPTDAGEALFGPMDGAETDG